MIILFPVDNWKIISCPHFLCSEYWPIMEAYVTRMTLSDMRTSSLSSNTSILTASHMSHCHKCYISSQSWLWIRILLTNQGHQWLLWHTDSIVTCITCWQDHHGHWSVLVQCRVSTYFMSLKLSGTSQIDRGMKILWSNSKCDLWLKESCLVSSYNFHKISDYNSDPNMMPLVISAP